MSFAITCFFLNSLTSRYYIAFSNKSFHHSLVLNSTQNNMTNNESVPTNQSDLEQIWLQIATDIKIRRFDNLGDLPEFQQLPNQLQNDLISATKELKNDYKMFHNEKGLTSFHVILYDKEKEKYAAIYEEKKPSEDIRSSLAAGGLLVVCLFIWHQLFKIINETQIRQLPLASINNSNGITMFSDWSNSLSIILSIVPSLIAYPLLKRWFSTQDSAYNKLIEGCMLKKLYGISTPQ